LQETLQMPVPIRPEQLEILKTYSAGRAGTRDTIEALGMQDYADLIIALAQTDLPFPKPEATPAHEANVARATAILQPRLRHGS
jgi:hypothetical protein